MILNLGLQNVRWAPESKKTRGYSITEGELILLTPILRTGKAEAVGSKLMRDMRMLGDMEYFNGAKSASELHSQLVGLT